MTREELAEKFKTIPTFKELVKPFNYVLIADCANYITKISSDDIFYSAPNFGILIRKQGDPQILVLDENFNMTDSFNDYCQVPLTNDKEINKRFDQLVQKIKEIRVQLNIEKARIDFK